MIMHVLLLEAYVVRLPKVRSPATGILFGQLFSNNIMSQSINDGMLILSEVAAQRGIYSWLKK